MSNPALDDDGLCPFSKPIIGNWCRCPYARLSERCSGKMVCDSSRAQLEQCVALVRLFRDKARFVLGFRGDEEELTHAQSMKIRCGGLFGMQRLLLPDSISPPAVLEVIAAAESRYGKLEAFPFSEIVADIQAFSHRTRRSS